MSLPLPGTPNSDRELQAKIDEIALQFPLGPEHLATAVGNQFPRLASAGSVKVNFGTVAIGWAATAAASSVATVNHGLGKTPIAVLITPDNTATLAGFAWAVTYNFTSTQFSAQAQRTANTTAGTGSITASWLAIG